MGLELADNVYDSVRESKTPSAMLQRLGCNAFDFFIALSNHNIQLCYSFFVTVLNKSISLMSVLRTVSESTGSNMIRLILMYLENFLKDDFVEENQKIDQCMVRNTFSTFGQFTNNISDYECMLRELGDMHEQKRCTIF